MIKAFLDGTACAFPDLFPPLVKVFHDDYCGCISYIMRGTRNEDTGFKCIVIFKSKAKVQNILTNEGCNSGHPDVCKGQHFPVRMICECLINNAPAFG